MDDSCQFSQKSVEARVTIRSPLLLPTIILNTHGFGFFGKGSDVACAKSVCLHFMSLGYMVDQQPARLAQIINAARLLGGLHANGAIGLRTERNVTLEVFQAATQGA